jgi:hypothetical protein
MFMSRVLCKRRFANRYLWIGRRNPEIQKGQRERQKFPGFSKPLFAASWDGARSGGIITSLVKIVGAGDSGD